jgi:glycosyltransferase involved in cell wall biosynthesis
MRVLQLVTTPRPFFDDQVTALERRGVECTTVTVPGTRGDRSLADYLRYVHRVRTGADERYDLVHANYGLTAPAAFAHPSSPVVLTFWGSDLMGGRWLTGLSRLAARRADAVVVPSKVLSSHLDCRHHRLPFGVDTDVFRPIPRHLARRRVGWDPDETVVLFPYSRDRPVKNHRLAERVVERIDADATLRTVSDVPHHRMPAYMNASDAVLVTSRRESGPMVVKEASACNVPVVSTDVGFVRDVLTPVDHSAVCRTETELVTMLDRMLASCGRSNGRWAADGLDVDHLGERLHALYESLLAGRPDEG